MIARKIIKFIITYILVFVLVCLLVASSSFIAVGAKLLSKENTKANLNKIGYYTELKNIITESSENYIMQSGFDDSIIDGVFEESMIESDVNSLVDKIYDGNDLTISTETVKSKLDENVKKFVDENDYTIDDETQKSINSFEDKIVGIYEKNVVLSEDVVNEVAQYYQKYKNMLLTAVIVVGVMALIIFIFFLIVDKSALGVACFVAGGLDLVFRFSSTINLTANNILIGNKAFSSFLSNTISGIMQIVMISGIILVALGILLIAVGSYKSSKAKALEIEKNTEENT